MQIRVLPFGILKDWLGASTLELPEGATVATLLERLAAAPAAVPASTWASIAVSVNHEYAQAAQMLREGDEVGLLPPVSGGSGEPDPSSLAHLIRGQGLRTATALYRVPIESAEIIEAIKKGEDGAVVVFDGIVRNNSRGRQTLHLDYEAYEEMAGKQMRELAQESVSRFGVRQVVIVHRLGRLLVGETSVLIVVASAHRAQAYEASRWLIDTLKKTVPIWKKETFVDGAVWADGEPFPEDIAAGRGEPAHG
ncbi:molybdenum cofactor biosynthesis protein MoaE [Occallatibacter riparius]|uniref:Molybdopterin synthase catalytic subunit n=1 Tax=Occallatibacter riparius TaxID=1002689 RepID=A0A9J7BSG2_9BACT|nr:molybdenum cofactor biosynthesis protein MoaE [Occallatibacter riparius]UWZ83846.1 molybdenum cofactor biosynthesis protein MoaE [Occallatibacter riparius]